MRTGTVLHHHRMYSPVLYYAGGRHEASGVAAGFVSGLPARCVLVPYFCEEKHTASTPRARVRVRVRVESYPLCLLTTCPL